MNDYLRLAEAAAKSKERSQKLEAELESLKVEIEKEKANHLQLLRELEQNIKNQLLAETHPQSMKIEEKQKLESSRSQVTTLNSEKKFKAITEPSSSFSNGPHEETGPVENPSKKQRTELPTPANVFVIDDNSQPSVKDTSSIIKTLTVETSRKPNDNNLNVRGKLNTQSGYSISEPKASSDMTNAKDDRSSLNVGMEGKDVAKSLLMLQQNKHNSDISKSTPSVPAPPPSIHFRVDDTKSAISDGAHESAEAFNRKKDRRYSAVQLDVLRFIEERLPDVQAIFTEQKKRETDILPCPQAPQGNYYVRNEDKEKYKLPAGIQGTKPRFGKQNFNVLLHNVMLSGKKLQLGSEYVNFEDPRDCGEVIEKLYKRFNSYLQEKNNGALPHPQRFRQSTASLASSSNAYLDAKDN